MMKEIFKALLSCLIGFLVIHYCVAPLTGILAIIGAFAVVLAVILALMKIFDLQF